MEDEAKRYKFSCGVEAMQDELTLEQDYKVMELIKSVNLTDFKALSIADLIKVFSENKLIEKFLTIIFCINEKSEDDLKKAESFNQLKNSELKEVITDFFILNPLAIDLLKTLRSVADTATISPTLSNSETSQTNLTQVS